MTNDKELKNIQYKTSILNDAKCNNEKTIDNFLEKEIQESNKLPWSKLNKPIKNAKLDEFVEKYKSENLDLNLSQLELTNLKLFLRQSLDAKKLNKVKELNYDKDAAKIVSIPNLDFNKTTRKFTLKSDRRISTLKSLAPKKTKQTRKVGGVQKTSPKTSPKSKK